MKTSVMNRVAMTLPEKVDALGVLGFLYGGNNRESKPILSALKEISSMSDDEISTILDISAKTFRNYKSTKKILSMRLAEHAIALYALYNHATKVFGSEDEFTKWLNQDNFHFDGQAPFSYLQAISGIKFIDDRLTAMEYGDNV